MKPKTSLQCNDSGWVVSVQAHSRRSLIELVVAVVMMLLGFVELKEIVGGGGVMQCLHLSQLLLTT